MSELGTHVRRGCNTRMRRAWSDLAVAGAATGPLVFGAALVALFAACYDNPTAPMLPRPPAPRKSVAGPMGSFSITIPAMNDTLTFGAISDEETHFYIPDNSTVVIQVEGTVTLAANSGYGVGPYAGGGGDLSIAGQVVPPTGAIRGGNPSQDLMVSYHLSGQSFTPSLTPDSAGASTYTFTYHAGVGGELLVSRTGVQGDQACVTYPWPDLPPNCTTPGDNVFQYHVPAYKMSGHQTISVTRLEDDVTLTAVASTGAKGRSVTFTAVPATPGGGVVAWTWTPDSGSAQTVACSGSENPCITAVYESGTMDVEYYVQSVDLYRHAKAHVTAVDCPTGDSLLDEPVIRQALLAALTASNPDSAPGSGYRHEEGGNIWRLPDGTYTITRFADPSPTECHVQFDISPTPPVAGAIRVSLFHTHPYTLGEDVYGCPDDADGNPQAQHPDDGKPVPQGAPNSNGGGSAGDWIVAGEQFDTYIINKDMNVYKLPVDNQPNPHADNPNKWHIRPDTGCWQLIS
jgi:hypothetical protein